VRYLATMPMMLFQFPNPMWTAERGVNLLDGGAPFYDTYKTKDGKYMAVYINSFKLSSDNSGALEPQFYAALLKGLELNGEEIPKRDDRSKWGELREIFTKIFLGKTQKEWEREFDGTDSCVTAVVPLAPEDHRPIAKLSHSPSLEVTKPKIEFLKAGDGTKEVLQEWMGWRDREDYTVDEKGTVNITRTTAKL